MFLRQPVGLRKTYTRTGGSVTTYASSPQSCHGYHYAAPKTHAASCVSFQGNRGGVGCCKGGKLWGERHICERTARKSLNLNYFVFFMGGFKRNIRKCIGIIPVSFLATYYPCCIHNGSVHGCPLPGSSKSDLAYWLLL